MKDGLFRSLRSQADLLFYNRHDPRGALPQCSEAVQMLVETGIEPKYLKKARALLEEICKKL